RIQTQFSKRTRAMPMHKIFVSLAILGVVSATQPASAQAPKSAQSRCFSESGDVAIAACTGLMASDTLGEIGLGVAYYNRGVALYEKGEYARAIEDYNQAIQLNPGFAPAFLNRGNAFDGKGEYERAIQDYDRAINLDPSNAKAFNN